MKSDVFRRSSMVITMLLLIVALAAVANALPQTFTVINVNDSGAGSLRQAILDSNANDPSPGANLIQFAIPGAGPFLIFPLTPLPALTQPVLIDGYSQTGATQNTLSNGENANLEIILNGFYIVGAGNGLTINANSCVVQGLVINNFPTGSCIEIDSTDNVIRGCFIGTDASGTLSGTTTTGILINSKDNNLIGGTAAADRNLISGCSTAGVYVYLNTLTGNTIQGNFIGTQRNGSTALANGQGIIVNNAINNKIGGTLPGAGNVISGNNVYNIQILGTSSGNTLEGNLIGTNATGTAAVAASAAGVTITSAFSNTIGGATSSERNIISGNGYGVYIGGTGATGNIVSNNWIGTDITGTLAIPNGIGVYIYNTANGNTVGVDNVIAFNSSDGVNVDGIGTVNNTITRNSIFSNAGLGIHLINSGNNSLPAPVLTSAVNGGGGVTIQGTFDDATQPNASITIEFFYSPACDNSGKTYIGSTAVLTDATGHAVINSTFPVVIAAGQYVTATATDPSGDTSQFSNCAQITAGLDLSIAKTIVSPNTSAGSDVVYLITVTNNSAQAASNVIIYDNLPATLTYVNSSVSNGGVIGGSGNNRTWTFASLAAGKTATVAVTAQILNSVVNGTKICNTATFTTSSPDTNPANNTSTVCFFVNNACVNNLRMVADLVSGNPIPAPGTTGTWVFRLQITACGTAAVYGITAIGDARGYQSATVSTGTLKLSGSVTDPMLTWRIVSLPMGSTATMLVTVRNTIPATAACGSTFQLSGQWDATYYTAGMKYSKSANTPINLTVTCP